MKLNKKANTNMKALAKGTINNAKAGNKETIMAMAIGAGSVIALQTVTGLIANACVNHTLKKAAKTYNATVKEMEDAVNAEFDD